MALLKIFKPFLKLTSESKSPTDSYLDDAIEQLHMYMPHINYLLKYIVREQITRLFKYRWRLLIGWTILTCSFAVLSYFAITKYVQPIIVHQTTNVKQVEIYRKDLKSFNEYVTAVGLRESSGIWENTENPSHHGYFQFSTNTLNLIGISVSKEEFLQNKELQLAAFKLLLRKNAETYKKYIVKWEGKKIRNVRGTVTCSGILLAFHLKPADAQLFFDSKGTNLGTGDGNGTKVNEYIELFSGYELPEYVTDVLTE